MAEPGQLGLGQLEAVGLVLAPPAQEHRLARLMLHLHPEQINEEVQAVIGERGEQLGVGDVGEVVDWLGHASTFSRRPSRSYESAPSLSLARLTRSRSARSREASSASSTRSECTTATPSASRTTMSPFRMVA